MANDGGGVSAVCRWPVPVGYVYGSSAAACCVPRVGLWGTQRFGDICGWGTHVGVFTLAGLVAGAPRAYLAEPSPRGLSGTGWCGGDE